MKAYILRIISVGIIIMISECLLPKGNIKKYALFALSALLTISLIFPLKEIVIPEITDIQSQEESTDYLLNAVKSTVNNIKGFENASVSIEEEKQKIISIHIKTNNSKMLENAIEDVHKDYLITILKSLYRTENVIIED